MARKHEAVTHLRDGLSPSQIAHEMGVTLNTVMSYLYNQVGEGTIQRSDIILSFPPTFRLAVERAITEAGSDKWSRVEYRLKKYGIAADFNELQVYLQLRKARAEFGDLYEWLRIIEIYLHLLIQTTLLKKYGSGWWRRLPLKVRQEGSMIYEEDENELSDRYCCTTFNHLKVIFEKLWVELSPSLPKAVSKDKKKFLRELMFINSVRNAVMHPVKDLPIGEEAFGRIRIFTSVMTGHASVPTETWGSILSIPPATTKLQ